METQTNEPVDKLTQLKNEHEQLLKSKQEDEQRNKKITELGLQMKDEERRILLEHQKLVDAEARTLMAQGLGEGTPYLHCFKCKAEIPITNLRQSIGKDEAVAYSLDGVCPYCSTTVTCQHPENRRLCMTVTYCYLKESGFSNLRIMRGN